MSQTSIPESLLDSQTPIVSVSKPPVIVVGLPRSGSSFLSYTLSALDDWYVFDDLYPYQSALSAGANPFLSDSQLKHYISRLSWAARARIKWERNFETLRCNLDDIDRLEQAIYATFEGCSATWSQVLEEWLTRIALLHDCHHWGYKTPQDFMNLDTLTSTFPGVQFVFIMRDPRKMMESMKNLVKKVGGDGDPHQYHPVAYALYWQMAYRKVNQFIESGKAPVRIIRFEHLVESPDLHADSLAAFLETTVSTPVQSNGTNSSFKSGKKHPLTQTERWICERLIGESMTSAGYELTHDSPRLKDIPDLIRTTLFFIGYQLQRLVQNKRSRVSLMSYFITLKSELFKTKAQAKLNHHPSR